LAAAPWRGESRAHGRQVGLKTGCEATQFGRCASVYSRKPLVETGEVVTVDEAEEPLHETTRLGNRRLDATERFDESLAILGFGLAHFREDHRAQKVPPWLLG
jgi:hypothetical protein